MKLECVKNDINHYYYDSEGRTQGEAKSYEKNQLIYNDYYKDNLIEGESLTYNYNEIKSY